MARPIIGVWLSAHFDLEGLYGPALRMAASDVVVLHPSAVKDPEEVRFALCWEPGPEAFSGFANLALAMSLGAGVDGLVDHPGLNDRTQVARIRDPLQADQMAGFTAHEILHREREFDTLTQAAAVRRWHPLAPRAPRSVQVAALGHGTMGRAVVRALSILGFGVRVACRTLPEAPMPGITYHTGPAAISDAAQGADYLVNVLPLTHETRDVLNAAVFARLKPGAWLVQIGRGEHLVEADLITALEAGHLAGASLDVFRQEPLPPDHVFWGNPKLRITPHVASISQTGVVAEQVVETMRALRDGGPMRYCIDRARGY